MKQERIRRLNNVEIDSSAAGPILYWMSREQRVDDNWALLAAQMLSQQTHRPMAVVFALSPTFLGATWRQYAFMLRGLRETESKLRRLNIPVYLVMGQPDVTIVDFARHIRAAALFTDFTPLRIGRLWRDTVASSLDIPVYEVDARNTIPCWVVSPKAEIAARTFRPKVHRLLSEYMDDYPVVASQQYAEHGLYVQPIDWDAALQSLDVDDSVGECDWIEPGEAAASRMLGRFLERIDRYDPDRNRPDIDAQSNLSPYLHFGHISAQRIAAEVLRVHAGSPSASAFLEELIVRRELADNFCFYNPNYDSVGCFPNWAKETLAAHASDERSHVYSRDQLDRGETHDPLWSAAQKEMRDFGKMHGYMRMYWAKKILEWSETPADAMADAIYLNDRYELDGRESNGYVGIAWSIGGVHDRPWPARSIFGTVRYMSYNGAKSKFDVDAYIRRVAAR